MAKTDSAYLASQQVFGFSMADERSNRTKYSLRFYLGCRQQIQRDPAWIKGILHSSVAWIEN